MPKQPLVDCDMIIVMLKKNLPAEVLRWAEDDQKAVLFPVMHSIESIRAGVHGHLYYIDGGGDPKLLGVQVDDARAVAHFRHRWPAWFVEAIGVMADGSDDTVQYLINEDEG